MYGDAVRRMVDLDVLMKCCVEVDCGFGIAKVRGSAARMVTR